MLESKASHSGNDFKNTDIKEKVDDDLFYCVDGVGIVKIKKKNNFNYFKSTHNLRDTLRNLWRRLHSCTTKTGFTSSYSAAAAATTRWRREICSWTWTAEGSHATK